MTINVVFLYTSACYSSIEIIFKIIILETSYITFTFVLISIAMNNTFYNTKGNKFGFKETVMNLDIFI